MKNVNARCEDRTPVKRGETQLFKGRSTRGERKFREGMKRTSFNRTCPGVEEHSKRPKKGYGRKFLVENLL